VQGRTNSIARTFDRVCSVLTVLGYLDGEQVTDSGRRLARIYSELDLVAAECLREGVWDGLNAAELACAASLLVYEARISDDAQPPRVPKGPAREAIERTLRLWSQTHNLEGDYDLDFQREPDTGFAWAAYRWASGHRLDAVLDEVGLPAGDFVRWCKQLIDLLGQIADAAAADPASGVRQAAREAVGPHPPRRGRLQLGDLSQGPDTSAGPGRLSGHGHGRGHGRAAGLKAPKTPPCGSRSRASRGPFSEGASSGPCSTSPPSSRAVAAVASTSATTKYGFQCEGVSPGYSSPISMVPPNMVSARPTIGYMSSGQVCQPKTSG
jgi:hypothetical protein